MDHIRNGLPTKPQVNVSITGKPSMPVKFWATVGVIMVMVIIYSLYQWFVSDHFHPAPVGTDPLPNSVLYMIRGLEIFTTSCGLALIWYTVVNPWRKTGELSWDGMLCIVAFTLWFQDPIDNYFNFAFSYNAHFINFTSWAPYIPGWESPRMENFPEPVFLMFGLYLVFLCGLSIFGGWVLTKCKNNWLPESSVVTHVLVCFAAFFAFDLVVEVIFCRMEIFAYGGTYHPLTLWAGEYYQFPIYESFCVAGIATTLTVLRYFKDDKGYSFAERGIHNLKISKRSKKLVSFLSILGFAHVAMFVVFFFPFNWFTLKADSYPQTSSYLRYEVCGQGTEYACPSREVPIPSKTSLSIGPDDPRLSAGAKAN